MSEPVYDVVWPLAPRAERHRRLSAGLDGAGGRTYAFVWDRLFRGDEMFDAARELILESDSDARFVGWEAFGDIHGSVEVEQAAVAALPDKLREYRVDAALVGVGA